MHPVRIAVLGFGKIAADQHLPAILANQNFQLAGTSTHDGSSPEPHFKDWRELIHSVADLKAVAITTPPSVRYEIARECIEAGLDCLLEKPPSASLSEVEALSRLAEAKGRTLFTAWHSQHNSAVEAAAQVLNGMQIAAMEVRWQEDVHKWHPGQRWIWEPGGFGVFDPGINAFSILTRIFPGNLFVSSADLAFPVNAHAPVSTDITFQSPACDGPITCYFDFLRTEGEDWTIEISTTDGLELRLINGGSALFLDGREQQLERLGEYTSIYREFADLIAKRRSRVDVAPLRLVADCMLHSRRRSAEPIYT